MQIFKDITNWLVEHRYGTITTLIFTIIFITAIYDLENPSWQDLAACAGHRLAHGYKDSATDLTDQAMDRMSTLPASEQPSTDEVLYHVTQVAKKIRKERYDNNDNSYNEKLGDYERHIITQSCKQIID